jgi:hypothetical protein
MPVREKFYATIGDNIRCKTFGRAKPGFFRVKFVDTGRVAVLPCQAVKRVCETPGCTNPPKKTKSGIVSPCCISCAKAKHDLHIKKAKRTIAHYSGDRREQLAVKTSGANIVRQELHISRWSHGGKTLWDKGAE